MKRLAWLTDIHLDFLPSTQEFDFFLESIIACSPDCVLLGGDISTAPLFERDIKRIEKRLQVPIYFVLGNHDFYHGSIAQMSSVVEQITLKSEWLNWLSKKGVVELTPNTGLIGHESWGDGHLGNGINSLVMLNDFFLIKELTSLSKKELFEQLNALGELGAKHFQELLPYALHRFRHLLVLTHVPPFREACWHQGRISDDEFLPHFTCKAVGEVLKGFMEAHPQCQMTVLCGHTHGQGEVDILPNLHVKTGGAEYGHPRLQSLIMID